MYTSTHDETPLRALEVCHQGRQPKRSPRRGFPGPMEVILVLHTLLYIYLAPYSRYI